MLGVHQRVHFSFGHLCEIKRLELLLSDTSAFHSMDACIYLHHPELGEVKIPNDSNYGPFNFGIWNAGY